jgi:hypothetical protein
LFSTAPYKFNNSDHINGQRLYKLFDKTITLNVVKRQGGEDQESKDFRTALGNLRMNRVKMNDWKLLSSRVRAKVALTAEDLSHFTNVIYIY